MTRPRKIALGRLRDTGLTRLEHARRAGRGGAEERVVAIVGMHRSGTSAVTGSLQEAGLYLGPVHRKNTFNLKGNREHGEIVKLHNAILAHSGGSWRFPPSPVVWNAEHRAWRDRILASFSGIELWGFKDPRTLLLLTFWREALGDTLELVGVFRDPRAVVASLLDRDGGGAGEWFDLWSHYNAELLREHDASPFPLVEFSTNAQEFRVRLVPVLRRLGLRTPRTPSFFDPRLPRAPQTFTCPADALRLFERLRATA